MPANAVVENVLGTIGAVCWSIQLIPQVFKSYKMKNTAGLSSWMLGIWARGVFLGAYVVVENINIPLIIQPQCFAALSSICWAQCLYYDQGKSKRFSITAAVVACFSAAGVEAALIFGAKAAEQNGHGQVTQAWGIVSAVFIAGGLIPQYLEIFRFRAVVGISLIFLVVDLMGGVFSLLSLVFAAGSFDIIASLSYGIVVVLELGVFVLAAILNPSHYRREALRRAADDEALNGSPTRSITSGSPIASLPPRPERAEEPRGRSSIRRVSIGLGWLDDAVTPYSAADETIQRPDSVERELSKERYALERVQARWA